MTSGGSLIPVGTIVKALDEDSVLCGEFIAGAEGQFGLMPIYRDDPYTPEDEGADPGDIIRFYFDDVMSPKAFQWTANGDAFNFYDIITSVDEEEADTPQGLSLQQNYPNPFNPMTTILFALPEKSHVNLSIFDLQGRRVITLVSGILSEGFKKRIWNGRDSRGNVVSSGVYFYRLKSGGKVLTRKMVLLR